MASVSSAWTRAAILPAALPLVLYIRDNYVGVSRVKGSSMEPTLRDGDVVLVRKCDAGSLWSVMSAIRTVPQVDAYSVNDDVERAEVIRFQRLHGIQSHGTAGWLASSRPPLVLPGHVLLYQNPVSLQKEYHIKRVVAVGGQWVRLSHQPIPRQIMDTDHNGRETVQTYYDNRLIALPVHTVHVEGENTANSVDSRTMGPISYNLVAGIAEYVIWPPSRWQRIQRRPVSDVEGAPRAVWY